MSSPVHVRDKNIEKILIATSLKPMTAYGVSKVFGIPVALCHRKMKMLEGLGLVACVRKVISDEKGTVKFYRAQEDKVNVTNGNGGYVVRIDVPTSVAMDICIGWRDFVA